MSETVRKLRAYHMIDDEGNEEILAPVMPAPAARAKLVLLDEGDKDVDELVLEVLARLGADDLADHYRRRVERWHRSEWL